MKKQTLPVVSLRHQEKLLRENRTFSIFQRLDQEPEFVYADDESSGRKYQANLWDVFGSGPSKLNTSTSTTNEDGGSRPARAGNVNVADRAKKVARPHTQGPPRAGMAWEIEEEAVLLQMTEKNWTAITIAITLQRTEEEVKRRYAYLMAAREESAKTKGKGRAAEDLLAGTGAGATALEAPLQDDASDTDPFMEGAKASAWDVEDPRGICLMSGEKILDAQEAVTLTHIHDHFEAAKYVAVASKFFDKTGRRIEPEVIKHQLMLNRR